MAEEESMDTEIDDVDRYINVGSETFRELFLTYEKRTCTSHR